MKNPNYYKEVKEHIDSIYEKTCDGEYIGTWKQFDCRLLEECVTELIKRGIMTKTSYQRIGSRGRRYTFHWVASSKPTNHLAVSIGDAIRHKQAARRDNYRVKQAAIKSRIQKDANVPVEHDIKLDIYDMGLPIGENIKSIKDVMSIASFTDVDLWNELKRRGYEIENGRLVIITRKYLD